MRLLSVRTAAPGDGPHVAALAGIALGVVDGYADRGLPGQVDAEGGRITLRYGQGICRVAVDDQGQVAGMVYTAPPISWLDEYPAPARPSLARLFTKIELLAVYEDHREHGLGGGLLAAVEDEERELGRHLLVANVALRDRSVLRWYRRRGYTIAAPGEPIIANSNRGPVSVVDTGDGYVLAAKALQSGCSLKRAESHDQSGIFIVQRRRG
ncbi:GNAT family N-acetyltransferase [Streptomyces sp. NRRL F-4489]|uniref:GNAT family N-acetyltransferase n=1 Tax=Streptomyces sp. NRRL F-4489 TaxID=1609095 RepID=UPI000AE188F0|nr:GNAT family N-acetyltransferase [Streptomyces sp. NRRL F-4489]